MVDAAWIGAVGGVAETVVLDSSEDGASIVERVGTSSWSRRINGASRGRSGAPNLARISCASTSLSSRHARR